MRKRAGATEDRLEIELAEVLSDVTHEMGSPDEDAALAKDGVEAHLQELLAEQPHWCGEGLRLVRREWPTDIGPVDLMCRDAEEAVGRGRDQAGRRASRRSSSSPATSSGSGSTRRSPLPRRAGRAGDQAAGAGAGASARGIDCVEVDLAVLRGEREPDLKLFAA